MHNPFENLADWPHTVVISFTILFVTILAGILYLGINWSRGMLLLIPIAAAARFGYYVFKGK